MTSDSIVDALILQMNFAESPEAERSAVVERAGSRPELVEELAGSLASRNGQDAATVCRALGYLGPAARDALPALQSVAGRRSMLVLKSLEADAAERAIVAIRADEPQFICDALASGRHDTRMGAVDAIAGGAVELSDEQAASAAEALARMLGEEDDRTGAIILQALVVLGERAEAALPEVARLASSPDPHGSVSEAMRVRFTAGLWSMGRAGLTVGPALATLLVDRNERIRRAAVQALRDVGAQSDEAIPALLKALRYESPPVMLTGLAPEELPGDLAEEAGEKRRAHQTRIRATAARALGQLGNAGEPVLSALAQATRATEAHLRYHAVAALGRIGARAHVSNDEVASALDRALAGDTAGHVRRAAARAMGRIPTHGQHKTAALARALDDLQTRKSAAWALEQAGEAALPAASALIDALDANERRRMVVVRALAAIGDEVMHDLRVGMHRDDKWRRIGCAEAVAEFGSAAKSMEPTLRELLFDRRPDVREAAEEALEAISGDRDAPARETEFDDTANPINEHVDEEMHSNGT